MSLVRLNIKGISYSQTQNGAYALILNEVDFSIVDRDINLLISGKEIDLSGLKNNIKNSQKKIFYFLLFVVCLYI